MNGRNINFIKSSASKSPQGENPAGNQFIGADAKRPSRIEIDISALRNNISAIKSKIAPGSKLMAVVKANAYGHGAVKISEVAQEEGIDYLGVAFIEEADEIRNAGIEIPIVLLYPEELQRSLEAVKRGYIITISDFETLRRMGEILKDSGTPIRYFLKINTGMNRYGMKIENTENLFEQVITEAGYKFFGFVTNLAGSNGGQETLSRKQEDIFIDLMNSARRSFGDDIFLSFESSGYLSKIEKSRGSLIRIGHLLYGSLDGGEREIKPLMTVKSRVAEIQNLEKGEGIGYGFSFIADRPMKIAVIPMGYADGYPWSLSNRGFVLIKGEIAKVVGRICMDAFMIDITDLKDCEQGDEVVIMGAMGDKTITSQLLGELAGSFSYEIMSRWSRRLPRIYK